MENEVNVTAEQQQGQTAEAKTYTQEEVDKLLQSEADRRVTEALKKHDAKNAEKVREAAKLAAMNEQQKYEYELSQREKAIAEKEEALALAENRAAASKILAEKGISQDLVEFVVAGDADEMDRRIKKVDKAFKASVEAEVKRRLGGRSPEKSVSTPAQMTKESFAKLSLAQMAELRKSNPELYAQFTGNV